MALRRPLIGPWPDALHSVVRDDVRRLRQGGLSLRQIAGELEMSESMVRFHLNPAARKKLRLRTAMRARERKAAEVALRRQREAKAIRAQGGSHR